jgi:Xaa-Pro aminopeptidase
VASVEAVRAGASGVDVDALGREMISAAGHGEHYGHGLGHGVGLEVHEKPTLSPRSTDTLAVGNAVTVEPGVYVPDSFGVRIEDLVVVTDGGCDILSSLPKSLTVVE